MGQRIRASRGRLARFAHRAMERLPLEIRQHLDNVTISIEELPQPDDIDADRRDPRTKVFGVYRGWPLATRGGIYHLTVPDQIAIFRRPLLAHCRSQRQLAEEVWRTLLHEVGHHLGLDDDQLTRMEHHG